MSESPNGLLPNAFEQWFCDRMLNISTLLSHLGIKPNTITLISLGFGFLAGVFVSMNWFGLAVTSFILMGLFDIFDGQVAKYTNQTSSFGAILDSTVDRFNEAFIMTGLGIYFYRSGESVWSLWLAIALTGSFIVSYVKARADGLGVSCKTGLLQRAERLVLLSLGLVFQGLILKSVIVMLAVLANVTVVQRLLYVKKLIDQDPKSVAGAEKIEI